MTKRSGPAGTDGEFTAWVTQHRSTLLRAGTLLTAGDTGHAEDLVQATLTKLYLRWRTAREADSTLAYARTVLVTTFIDAGRRAFRRRELLVAEARPALIGPDESGQADLRLAVLTALGELPPRQRAVVVLRHWFDLDVVTTANELGCSEGTVKSQTAKALAHLKARLEPVITLEETP
ncbi:MAG TPA: SigE family RNA polymerase sigma factor [Nocardioides sp.]|jgi:RNA polymerase sigma-70 factor (sigma-E family)|nr:SigE family RNA polymerase sigma factor [Nocardioides sp.]